jgi:Mob1/phocein family
MAMVFFTNTFGSRLAQDLSHPLITTLQQECTRATCPEMKAGEWLYLCVAHGDDGAREVRTISSVYIPSDVVSSNVVRSIIFYIHSTAPRLY